ncbi:putative Fumarylacetoacetase-like C-terminal domain-containing protein [Seiridium cardinale]
MGMPARKWDSMPFFTCPPTTSMIGSGQKVKYPFGTSQFDWECELVVVVGARLHRANHEQAARAIAGYTIGLDWSCRDLLARKIGGLVDLMRGKAQKPMKPCGPSFVSKRFASDVQNAPVKLWVNGELMINGTTADMIWKPEEYLAEIGKLVTLGPGDMIMTGIPAGSAKSHGGRWLKIGDRISA